MSSFSETPHAPDAAAPAHASRDLRLPLLASAGILLLSFIWQLRWGTIPDTSWLIHVGERMLAGERLYVDVLETNPPFSIWLYLPMVALAQWLGVAAEPLVHLMTLTAVVAGLSLAGFLAIRAGLPEAGWLIRLSPAFLALFVLVAGNAFSERDHIGVVLFLPLPVLMAWRLRDPRGPTLPLAVAAGLSASLLLVVKPHYALLVLAPALWVAWRTRRPLAILAPEYWTIGIVCSAYLGLVLWLHPEFVRDMLPLFSTTYVAVTAYWRVLLYLGAMLLVFYLAWRCSPGRRPTDLTTVLLIASAAAYLVALAQGKGWPYHVYPALALGLCAMLAALAASFAARDAGGPRVEGIGLAAAAMLICAIPLQESQKPTAETVAVIRAAVDRPKVGFVATDLAVGHPLVRMVGGEWVSAHHSDWLGAYAYLLAERARLAGDATREAHFRGIVEDYVAAKRAEFEASPPDILLMQKKDAVWADHLLVGHGFAPLVANYVLLHDDPDYRVMIRDDIAPAALDDASQPASPAAE